jgi:hypothetical protein
LMDWKTCANISNRQPWQHLGNSDLGQRLLHQRNGLFKRQNFGF